MSARYDRPKVDLGSDAAIGREIQKASSYGFRAQPGRSCSGLAGCWLLRARIDRQTLEHLHYVYFFSKKISKVSEHGLLNCDGHDGFPSKKMGGGWFLGSTSLVHLFAGWLPQWSLAVPLNLWVKARWLWISPPGFLIGLREKTQRMRRAAQLGGIVSQRIFI